MKSCTDLRCAQRLHRTNLLGQPRAGGAAGVSRSSVICISFIHYTSVCGLGLLVDTQTNNLVETTQRIPDVSPALRINGRPHSTPSGAHPHGTLSAVAPVDRQHNMIGLMGTQENSPWPTSLGAGQHSLHPCRTLAGVTADRRSTRPVRATRRQSLSPYAQRPTNQSMHEVATTKRIIMRSPPEGWPTHRRAAADTPATRRRGARGGGSRPAREGSVFIGAESVATFT